MKYLLKNKLIAINQIGFIQGSSTADHIFTLQTIIDKFIKSTKKPLYICFVDFKKAFDTIWHSGLLYKLQKNEIKGHFYNIIKDMYSKVRFRVKTSNGLTEPIQSNIGVRQGDVLSPMLFNLYINDINDYLNDPLCDLISLNDKLVKCLMYADDIVLLSSSQKGLQRQLRILEEYCTEWQLNINAKKTKIMVASNRKISAKFIYKDVELEQVDSFPYLGILFNSKGNFKENTVRLSNKAQRAMYKLGNYNSQIPLSISKQAHIFDHTIRPILLYGAEVTYEFNPDTKKSFEDHKCESILEKIHKKFLRRMLGLNNKSPIDALYGDTGRYPFYIEIIKRMTMYEYKLKKADDSTLLYHARIENEHMADRGIHTWSSNLKYIKDALNCNHTYTRNKNTKHITDKLRERFLDNWYNRLHNDTRTKVNERNKLRTYRTFKYIFKQERYLDIISDFRIRSNYCKFRSSAHNLLIEIGRHSNIDLNKRICNKCEKNMP